MNREILNNKIWYRAIKVLFVVVFIMIEMIGLFFAHSIASQEKSPLNINDLIYSGAALKNVSTGVDISNNDSQVQQSLLTRLVLSGVKPSDFQRESVGKPPISDKDFQNLKSNIEKMVRAGVKNQGINSYTKWAFGGFDQGKNIQPLPESPPNLNKYSIIQKVGIYLLTFLIVLIFFWLLSRIFFYIILGEKFLRINTKE